MKWILKGRRSAAIPMSQALGISPITAQLLLSRHINTGRKAAEFFAPTLDGFGNIDTLPEVTRAYEIISESIKNNEKITIYGDYDADGVMSSVILIKALRGLGAEVSCYIPDRFGQGYGLSLGAVKEIYDSGTKLIICCDNGISAIEECRYIKSLGMKLIILDHHSPHEKNGVQILPEADGLIDMKIESVTYPFKEFCAAGLCYRFVHGFYESLGKEIKNEAELFIFAAIGTVCDMVSLTGENRIIAHMGLRLINSRKNTNPGLREIISAQGLDGKQITDRTLGFMIGPFINAAGRLAKAADYIDIFLSEDKEKICSLVQKLKELNDLRKAYTEEAYNRIIKAIGENQPDKVIVWYDKEIHESVAGLAAGRLKETFSRPAIVFAHGNEYAKGSGRSVESYDMFSAINSCRELFVRYGGHKMAVGITIRPENIEALRKRLNDECPLSEKELEETLYIDAEVGFSQIDMKLIDEIDMMKPFGTDNVQPLFATKEVYIKRIRFVGKNRDILQFVFFDGQTEMRGVGFGIFEKFKSLIIKEFGALSWEELYSERQGLQFFVDIVYRAEKNVFNGNESIQLRLTDLRMH